MARWVWCALVALLLVPPAPRAAAAQAQYAAIGAGVGAAGGAVITLSIVVARARFQREYLDSPHDLIHWQSTPMILAPAVGVLFGLAGDDALQGSILGSSSGLLVGSIGGAGVGWLFSRYQEGPWAGAVIGAGLGLTVGGLVGGLRAWSRDDNPKIDLPRSLRFNFSVPVP